MGNCFSWFSHLLHWRDATLRVILQKSAEFLSISFYHSMALLAVRSTVFSSFAAGFSQDLYSALVGIAELWDYWIINYI